LQNWAKLSSLVLREREETKTRYFAPKTFQSLLKILILIWALKLYYTFDLSLDVNGFFYILQLQNRLPKIAYFVSAMWLFFVINELNASKNDYCLMLPKQEKTVINYDFLLQWFSQHFFFKFLRTMPIFAVVGKGLLLINGQYWAFLWMLHLNRQCFYFVWRIYCRIDFENFDFEKKIFISSF
jgi:hypothetical protein